MFGELYFQMSLRYTVADVGLDTEEERPYCTLIISIGFLKD